MKTITIDNKITRSGVLAGLIGGGLLTFFSAVDLKLGYLVGYLLILTYIFSLFCARKIYKNLENNNSTFCKRTIVGVLTYFIMTSLLTLFQLTFKQFNIDGSINNYVLLILVHIAFGLTISLLFAIRPKSPNG